MEIVSSRSSGLPCVRLSQSAGAHDRDVRQPAKTADNCGENSIKILSAPKAIFLRLDHGLLAGRLGLTPKTSIFFSALASALTPDNLRQRAVGVEKIRYCPMTLLISRLLHDHSSVQIRIVHGFC